MQTILSSISHLSDRLFCRNCGNYGNLNSRLRKYRVIGQNYLSLRTYTIVIMPYYYDSLNISLDQFRYSTDLSDQIGTHRTAISDVKIRLTFFISYLFLLAILNCPYTYIDFPKPHLYPSIYEMFTRVWLVYDLAKINEVIQRFIKKL